MTKRRLYHKAICHHTCFHGDGRWYNKLLEVITQWTIRQPIKVMAAHRCIHHLCFCIILINKKGWPFLPLRLYKDNACIQTCLNIAFLNGSFSNSQKDSYAEADFKLCICKKRHILLRYWNHTHESQLNSGRFSSLCLPFYQLKFVLFIVRHWQETDRRERLRALLHKD